MEKMKLTLTCSPAAPRAQFWDLTHHFLNTYSGLLRLFFYLATVYSRTVGQYGANVLQLKAAYVHIVQ